MNIVFISKIIVIKSGNPSLWVPAFGVLLCIGRFILIGFSLARQVGLLRFHSPISPVFSPFCPALGRLIVGVCPPVFRVGFVGTPVSTFPLSLSPALAFPLILQPVKRLRQVVDDIPGDEAFLPLFPGSDVTSQPMQIHAQSAGIRLLVSPCQ